MTAAFPPPSLAARPILFSSPMVRALLAGRKTQMRRILKPQPDMAKIGHPCHPEPRGNRHWVWMARDNRPDYQYATADFNVPFEVGDRLWVRETWQTIALDAATTLCAYRANCDGDRLTYAGDGSVEIIQIHKWRPAIFMPRVMSRLMLAITDVRVQRLQDISEADAKAEGVEAAIAGRSGDGPIYTWRTGFVGVWQAINGNWLDNPWIVALTFTVERRNIDAECTP